MRPQQVRACDKYILETEKANVKPMLNAPKLRAFNIHIKEKHLIQKGTESEGAQNNLSHGFEADRVQGRKSPVIKAVSTAESATIMRERLKSARITATSVPAIAVMTFPVE